MIEVLDLCFQGRSQCVASFLLDSGPKPLLVECGPATCRPALLRELSQRNLSPADLGGLLVTHIHLDHAGDAGWWAQQGVPVVVHPLGAPHLIDPSKLLASATRIYGDNMERLWGEILPCPAEKVVVAPLEGTLPPPFEQIRVWDSPGHARHHLAFQLGEDLLCGDVAAVRLPGESFLSVPAPPPEFELETWLATLDRLEAGNFRHLYLTHFGQVTDSRAHFGELRERLRQVCDFVGERLGMPREELVQAYRDWQRPQFASEQAFDRYEQANPLFMSVDGLLRYWKKKNP